MDIKIKYVQLNEKDVCPMILIDSKDFSYSNIYNMYNTKSTQGRGIQVDIPEEAEDLMDLCDTISQAIYDYKIKRGSLK